MRLLTQTKQKHKQHTPIKKAKDLAAKFAKPVIEHKFDFIDRSLKTLKLDGKGYTIQSNKGVILVFDKKTNKLAAKISPPGKFGINYAFVEPKTTDEGPLRYALDKNGKIIFQFTSLSGANQFSKNFSEALKFSKGIE